VLSLARAIPAPFDRALRVASEPSSATSQARPDGWAAAQECIVRVGDPGAAIGCGGELMARFAAISARVWNAVTLNENCRGLARAHGVE
jgi:hypothetical protein